MALFNGFTKLAQANTFRMLGCPKTLLRNSSSDAGKSDPRDISNQGKLVESQFKEGALTHHKINKVEKYLLVWVGKYKSVAEVPNYLSPSVIETARSKARIKASFYMIFATLVGCLVMVKSGKNAASRGEDISYINAEFHRKYSEDAAKREASKTQS